jgi:uncharacterized protein (TIGR02001 family)
MRLSTLRFSGLLLAAVAATPVSAEDAPAAAPAAAPAPTPEFTVTGGATVVSDYKFRGISQAGSEVAIQGTLSLNHKSGLYATVWASSTGSANYDGANTEVDLSAGYHGTSGPIGFDIGALYYYYPGSTNRPTTDYLEPYASVNYTVPKISTNLKLGTNYAWKQGTFGRANVYVYGEVAQPIPKTPLTLHGHVGYTRAASYYLNTLAVKNEGNYVDYFVGCDYVWKNVTFNVSYVGTDISRARAFDYGFTAYNPYKDTKGRFVFSLGASF